MYTTKLDVVNACLATMGAAPLNSLDDEHAFKQSALDYLDASNRAVQKRALWFNTEYIELVPDAVSKFVYVPQDAIKVERVSDMQPKFGQRGRRLYNTDQNSYEWDSRVCVKLVRLLPFEDCPFEAQDAISLSAVLRFQREFDGDQARYNQLDQDRRRADMELMAQHTREEKVNLLDPIRAKMYSAGVRPAALSTGSYRYSPILR